MIRVVIQLLLAGIVGYSVAMILMAFNAETQTHASGVPRGLLQRRRGVVVLRHCNPGDAL